MRANWLLLTKTVKDSRGRRFNHANYFKPVKLFFPLLSKSVDTQNQNTAWFKKKKKDFNDLNAEFPLFILFYSLLKVIEEILE